MCETLWKSRDVLFFALQTLTSLLYFFLLEKSSWLLYIVMMLMMTMITYLLAVQGALLPACVCMKGVMIVWPNGDDVMKMRMISGVSVFIATMLNVFLSFLSMRDSWESLVCFGLCVCVVCGCFWTLICSSQGSELMVIWRLAFERESEWVDVLCVCVLDCVIAKKFKNIGTIAYVS